MKNTIGVAVYDEHTEVYGFGAQTVDEGLAEARRAINGWLRAWPLLRTFRAEFYRFCAVCKLSGIKPGCKRKPCEACKGTGRVDVTDMRDTEALSDLQRSLERAIERGAMLAELYAEKPAKKKAKHKVAKRKVAK